MKKHFQSTIRIASVLLIFTVFFISCTDRNTENVPPKDSYKTVANEDEIFSVNGILGFASSKAFKKYIEENPLSNQSFRTQFEEKFKYTSMQSSFEKSLVLDSIKQSEYVQKKSFVSFEKGNLQLNFGPSISNIVNDEGLILIGSRLYRFLNDEVRSISIANKRSLTEAISLLKTNEKVVIDVKVDSIKSLPINLKNDISGQNDRVGPSNYNVTSNTVTFNGDNNFYGLTEHFRTYGHFGLSIIPMMDQFCEAGIVYDEDSRGYVCAGPIVETQYYVNTIGCTVYGTVDWDENNHGGGNGLNGDYVRVDGNITVYANGTTIPISLSVQSNSKYYNFFPYSAISYNVGNTVEVEGTITFKTQHSRKYSGLLPNPITSVSLTI